MVLDLAAGIGWVMTECGNSLRAVRMHRLVSQNYQIQCPHFPTGWRV